MNSEKVGKFVANCRKEKNITQTQLGKIIGVDRRTISKWENGIIYIDIAVLEKLADTLGVTVLELLHGERYDDKNTVWSKSTGERKKIFANKAVNNLIMITIIVFIIGGVALFTKDYYSFKTHKILFYKDGYSINGEIVSSKAEKHIFIDKVVYDIYSTKDEILTNQVKVTLYYKERELTSNKYTLENNEKDTISHILKNLVIDYTDKNVKNKIKTIEDLYLTIEYLDEDKENQSIKVYLQTY